MANITKLAFDGSLHFAAVRPFLFGDSQETSTSHFAVITRAELLEFRRLPAKLIDNSLGGCASLVEELEISWIGVYKSEAGSVRDCF